MLSPIPELEYLAVYVFDIANSGLESLGNFSRNLCDFRLVLLDKEERITELPLDNGVRALLYDYTELRKFALYLRPGGPSDVGLRYIANSGLESIGNFNRNPCDFRLILLDGEERITELPLDNGIRALLQGCTKLRKFALYLRPGGLSNVGLGFIGEYSRTVRWILMGNVKDSDVGLLMFSRGCPLLQKLDLRSCYFSERMLAEAATRGEQTGTGTELPVPNS